MEQVYSVHLEEENEGVVKRSLLLDMLSKRLKECNNISVQRKDELTVEGRRGRGEQFFAMMNQTEASYFPTLIYELSYQVRKNGGRDGYVDRWALCSGVGGGDSWRLAREDSRHALFPLATVAALISSTNRDGVGETASAMPLPVEGRAFCTLPLPIFTGLVC